MRARHPIGTILRIQATVTNREGGTPFLYTHYSWPYTVVTKEEAEHAIAESLPSK
jgi:hypothetical protein